MPWIIPNYSEELYGLATESLLADTPTCQLDNLYRQEPQLEKWYPGWFRDGLAKGSLRSVRLF